MTKKQAAKATIFILLFLLILQSITYIIRTNGDIKDIFTGFYAEKKDTLDVILIGSSPVYTYYSAPQIWGETGIACYPLSSNVQRPGAALPLIREAEKTQSPRVFVFEMRMYTMEDGDMSENMAFARGVTDNMKYSANRIYAINRLVTTKEDRYTYYFDIFKYHSNWKTMVLPDQIRCVTYEKKNPLKGFVIRDHVALLSEPELDYRQITATRPIPEEQEERLRELLQVLKDNEQQALFIVSPYTAKEDEAEMFNYMQQIVEGEGYTFVNMNLHTDEIGLDYTTDFHDIGHANLSGAMKCSTYLGHLLQEYDISDKRGEKDYESFDKAYQYFQNIQTDTMMKIQEKIETGDYADPYGEAEE